jgi:SAM-dependent methyltransferase
METQALSVKRAQVEFHNFASLGEPERALRKYSEENRRRGAILRRHADFIGSMTPFLEIGANVGHTSYMLTNEFGAEGFALDISADALRYGAALQEIWEMPRAPVRVAGDAANLPFADSSLQFVITCQTLSQFMDLEPIFSEVARVLKPGGVFLFAEEPVRRLLSLRLYRCPYYDTMKPWERKLSDWGLLGYLVKDVIGADQEESFGIRQNHRMYLNHWNDLVSRHFGERRYQIFVPERGWGERVVKRLAVKLDPYGSEWRAARLLGGTLAAICRKPGAANGDAGSPLVEFERYLRCPDCRRAVIRDATDTLACTVCAYRAANEGGVYNLLRSTDRRELYPGDREDVIDFSLPSHDTHLREGWFELEGIYGNKYRWIGRHASAVLKRVGEGPQRIRIRAHAQDHSFRHGGPVTLEVRANGHVVTRYAVDRIGLFIVEADLPDAPEYHIELIASPEWTVPTDDRVLTFNVSMIRLIPRDHRASAG